MTQESNAALLQAYKYATEADQDGIADLLETVILELMGSDEVKVPVMRGIKIGDEEPQVKSPWTISCGPDVVTLGGAMECTGIDHLSKELTV